MVNWDVQDMRDAFCAQGLQVVALDVHDVSAERLVTARQIERWFGAGGVERPSYGDHLRRVMSKTAVTEIHHLYERQMKGQSAVWRSRILNLVARSAE